MTKAQRKRARMADKRPLGPADCMRARFAGQCSTCGCMTQPIHSPMRRYSGTYCAVCCPCCRPAAASEPASLPWEAA